MIHPSLYKFQEVNVTDRGLFTLIDQLSVNVIRVGPTCILYIPLENVLHNGPKVSLVNLNLGPSSIYIKHFRGCTLRLHVVSNT